MKMYIPELGTKLKLTKRWAIRVEWERRNYLLIKEMVPALFAEYETQYETWIEDIGFGDKRKVTWGHGYAALGYTDADMRDDIYHGKPLNPTRYDAVHKWLEDQKDKAHAVWQAFLKRRDSTDLDYSWPAGTILEVDRIYIRKGAADFSSVTFKIRGKKVIRFWVKLEDVNRIDCQIIVD